MSIESWKATLVRAWKKGDIFPKMVCFLLIKLGFSNKELQALEVRNKNYHYLRKKYTHVLEKINYEKAEYDEDGMENVWVCWFQGIENAPKLIQKCVDSIYINLPEKNIHIITEENMFDYVEFPEYVIEKWKKGIISYTHLSDLLRTELLIRYGGLWLDATVYLTDQIPQYVYEKPLFMFHYKVREDMTISNNNWFIFARKNNRTLKTLRDLLYEYWKIENRVREYFFWHLFLKMVFEKYPEDYDDIYYVSDEMAHMLQYNIFKKFDPIYWEQITRFSVVHKLTYKLNVPSNYEGSYYEYIMKDKSEEY